MQWTNNVFGLNRCPNTVSCNGLIGVGDTKWIKQTAQFHTMD